MQWLENLQYLYIYYVEVQPLYTVIYFQKNVYTVHTSGEKTGQSGVRVSLFMLFKTLSTELRNLRYGMQLLSQAINPIWFMDAQEYCEMAEIRQTTGYEY